MSGQLRIRTDISTLNPTLIDKWVHQAGFSSRQQWSTARQCTHCEIRCKSGRRHNCRLCGSIFCSDCTQKYDVPRAFRRKGKEGPSRVCYDCRDICLDARQQVRDEIIVLRPSQRVRTVDGRTVWSIPEWESLSAVSDCLDCKLEFPSRDKSHNCRMCGHLFCEDCSIKADIPIPGTFRKKGKRGPTRVCYECRYRYFSGVDFDAGQGGRFAAQQKVKKHMSDIHTSTDRNSTYSNSRSSNLTTVSGHPDPNYVERFGDGSILEELQLSQLRQSTSPRSDAAYSLPVRRSPPPPRQQNPFRQQNPSHHNPSHQQNPSHHQNTSHQRPTFRPTFFGDTGVHDNGGRSQGGQYENPMQEQRPLLPQNDERYSSSPYVVPVLDDTRFPTLNTLYRDSPSRSLDELRRGPSNLSNTDSKSNSLTTFQPQARLRKASSIERSFSHKHSLEGLDKSEFSQHSMAHLFPPPAAMNHAEYETRPRRMTDEQIKSANLFARQLAQMSARGIQLPGMGKENIQSQRHEPLYEAAPKLSIIQESPSQTVQRLQAPKSGRDDRGASKETQFSMLTNDSMRIEGRRTSKFSNYDANSTEIDESISSKKESMERGELPELPEYNARVATRRWSR